MHFSEDLQKSLPEKFHHAELRKTFAFFEVWATSASGQSSPRCARGHPHTIKGIFKGVWGGGSPGAPSLANSPWRRRRLLGEGAQVSGLGRERGRIRESLGGVRRGRDREQRTDKESTDQHAQGRG